MTKNRDKIARLLDTAPPVPASPHLREDIHLTLLLDSAPTVPASPNLHDKILETATSQNPTADIMDFAAAHAATRSRQQNQRHWPIANVLAGGLMAASLMLGFVTGTADLTNSLTNDLISAPLELAGLVPTENTETFNYYSVTDGLTATDDLL